MELALDLTKQYTYADYLTWLDDKSRELINGFIHMMSAPLRIHAEVSYNILLNLGAILKQNKGKCKVYPAPFDVRFPKNGETADDKIYTVVQPDICVVCDLSKLDKRGCCGAPDMIVEVLSPSTNKRDFNDKFNLYEEHGVKEYWIVNPDSKNINVFILQENGKYDVGTIYELEERLESGVDTKMPIHIFDNYKVDLKDIFDI